MEEGTGILMVDDVHMYVPFLHPLAFDNKNKVFASLCHYVYCYTASRNGTRRLLFSCDKM